MAKTDKDFRYKISLMHGYRAYKPAASFCKRALVAFVLFVALVLLGAAQERDADSHVQKLYEQAKAEEARGDTSAAIANYSEILRIAPKLGGAYNNLGVLYFRQREFEKAVDILERGLKVDPAMPTASALLGISLFQLSRYAEARPHLETALRSNPHDNEAAKVLAKDLIQLHDLQGAVTRLRQFVQRQPNDQEAWYLLGEIYMQLSQQALSKMNAIDPNSELVHEISGEIMESMKNYDGALLEYRKAADMSPTKPGIHYKLGNVYWSLAQFDAANKEFQAELANDPRNCRARALIGDILIDQEMKFEDGLEAINKALAICPDLSQGRIDRGRALLKMHRNNEALRDLQAAVQSTPGESSAHFFLAQAYRALGRTQDAKSEMEIYSKLEESARAATAERAREVIENKEAPH